MTLIRLVQGNLDGHMVKVKLLEIGANRLFHSQNISAFFGVIIQGTNVGFAIQRQA